MIFLKMRDLSRLLPIRCDEENSHTNAKYSMTNHYKLIMSNKSDRATIPDLLVMINKYKIENDLENTE